MLTPHLDIVVEALTQVGLTDTHHYAVPGVWIGSSTEVLYPNASAYLLEQIAALGSTHYKRPQQALVYNALVRQVTSYDHYGGHSGDVTKLFCTQGTFIKLIALIPYLKSLGVTQVVLLPICKGGSIGKKGTLGSPYAVQNIFTLDPVYDEPALGLPLLVQAQAMIEAFHSVDISVVLEQVLRTASIDSELVPEHPEWFYWVAEEDLTGTGLMPPVFSAEELAKMHHNVERQDHSDLPEPSEEYRSRFCQPPKHVERDNTGWVGYSHSGERLRIPGAFADWPPDDSQPLWSDVTYLKLHKHPDFAYPAYNTLRMFDQRLEHEEYEQHDLWNMLQEIIPHWIRLLDIDGIMIDMGHALPLKLRHGILQRAWECKPNLLVYEERFEINGDLRLQGIDAVMGYLPHAARRYKELKEFTLRSQRKEFALSFFATVDSHNTPRITRDHDEHASYAIWQYVALLPRGLPFIVAGFDIGETYPINTGLDFTPDEIRSYHDVGLPLFDDIQLCWHRLSAVTIALRNRCQHVCDDQVYDLLGDDDDITLLADDDATCLVYMRVPIGSHRGLLVALNMGSTQKAVEITKNGIVDIAAYECVARREDAFEVRIDAGCCLVLPILLKRH